MAENDVLIKIAADIASAVAALQQMTGQLGDVVDAVKKTDEQTQASQKTQQSFWDAWLKNVDLGKTAAVAWGNVVASASEKVGDAVKHVILALPDMVKATADAGDEMLTLSNRLNVSVETLGELQFISKQTGAPMMALSRTIQGLGEALADGTSNQATAIQSLGLNIDDLKKQKPEDAFYAILDAVKTTVPASEQSAKAIEVFGRSFRSSTQLLHEDVAGIRKDFQDLGGSMSTDLAKQGDAFNDNMARIQLVEENFRNSLAEKLLPTVNELLEKMPKLGGAALTLGDEFKEAAGNILPIVSTFASLKSAGALEWAGKMVVAIPGVTGVLAALGEAGPIAAAAIVGVGSELALLYGTKKAVDFIGSWVSGLKIWTGGFDTLGEHVDALVVKLGGFLGILPKMNDADIKGFISKQKQLQAELDTTTKQFAYFQLKMEGWLGIGPKLSDEQIRVAMALNDVADAAGKAGKAADESTSANIKQVSGLDQLAKKNAKVQAAYKALTSEEKSLIKSSFDAGSSAQELGKALAKDMGVSADIATAAISKFKTELDKAKTAAQSDPLVVLAKDAKALATAIDRATAAHLPLKDVIAQLGTKATDVANRAALIPGELQKINPAIVSIAQQFQQAALDVKLKTINDAGKQLVLTFTQKMTAATDATTATVASMTHQLTANLLTGKAARLDAIDTSEKAAIDALNRQQLATQQEEDAAIRSIMAQAAAKKKALQDSQLAGQKVSQADIDAINKEEDAAVAAVHASTEAKLVEGAKQTDLTKQQYQQQRDIENKATGDFEKDMELRGVKTQAAYTEDLATQQATLDEMTKNRSQFTLQEMQDQENKVQAAKDAADGVLTKTKQDLDLERDHQQQILTQMLADRGKYTDAEILDQQKIVDDAKTKAKGVAGDWSATASSIGSAFQQLATIAGSTFSAIAQAIGTATSAGGMLHTSFDAMHKELTGQVKDWKSFTQNAAAAAGAAIQAGQAIMQATDSLSTAKNVAGGAMAGAEAGASFGPWGALVGAGVGAVVGAFRNKDAQRAFKEVATDTGIQISDDLAKSIQDESNKTFGGGQGGRWAAEVFHLGDIIKDAGGVTAKNFEGVAKEFQQGLTFLDEGKFSVDQFKQMADESFPQIAKAAEDMGGIWTQSFQQIVQQVKATGVQVQGLSDLMDQEMTKGASGLNNVITGFLSSPAAKSATDLYAQQQQILQDVQSQGGDISADQQQQLDALAASLEGVRAQTVGSQDEFDRLGRISLATFNSMVANGKTTVEAITAIAPSIESLKDGMQAMGLHSNAAFDQLSRLSDLTSANQGLLDSVSGLNDVMTTLANLGGLDAQTFQDLQDQGVAAFNQLTSAGFTQNEALTQEKGFLESVIKAHQQNGAAIDDATQALIDQATQQGILSDETESTNDIMVQGFSAIIDAVGGKIPDAFKQMTAAAQQTATDVGTAMTTSVNATLDKTTQTLQTTPWTEYSTNAQQAALVASKAVKDQLQGSVDDVSGALKDANWEAWSKQAIAAATAVQDAVDGVSLGHSPGGLKEIPLKMADAMKAFKDFETVGVGSAQQVEDAVNAMHAAVAAQQQLAAQAAEAGVGDAISNTVNFQVNALDTDSVRRAVKTTIGPELLDWIGRSGTQKAKLNTTLRT